MPQNQPKAPAAIHHNLAMHMDLDLSPSERQFRDEVRTWLEQNAPQPWQHGGGDESDRAYFDYLRAWQRRLYDGGWCGVAWPKEYGGRGATFIEQSIFQEELARVGAPEIIGIIGVALAGPTIISLGTEEQKRRYLSKILSAEEIWCQGFSEPNAGSDLASLGTRAALEGETFIVNGQKIWTSFAHVADWCLLLVRTDPAAPKHKGITCLLVDMRSPGIEVRPLRMMSGDAAFNEVFFTDVRVPVGQMLGQLNAGWTAAITALMNERANLGAGVYTMLKRQFDALVARVQQTKRGGRPALEDSSVRQTLAWLHTELEVFRLNISRALTSLSKTGMPGAEGSIQKLFWSEFNQRMTQASLELLGPEALRSDFDGGVWAYHYLRSRGNTIEAGTSEIQRGIIGQRVLGLPRSY